MRNLVLVLGDQLNHDSAAFDGFDHLQDAVWMAEVEQEATYVWSHKLRITLFFSAMRHFRAELARKNIKVHYTEIAEQAEFDRGKDLTSVLREDLHEFSPIRLIMAQPGDFRVLRNIRQLAVEMAIELEVRADRHFYCGIGEFKEYAVSKKKLILENFYRHLRKKHSVLIAESGKPHGGAWNFDKENRQAFNEKVRETIPKPVSSVVDGITRQVIATVKSRFRDHPGLLDSFDLPVSRDEAQQMLKGFIQNGLEKFGPYQDAMWMNEPFLFHSRLSSSLNLKLIHPQECISAAVSAYDLGHAPIASVEGFVRQILGWREYIRGIYWLFMPDYAEMNYLNHQLDLPTFYWDGQTNMRCFQQTMKQIIRHGYSHHIQRLMVVGLFALLLGCDPRKFHQWHMAMYVDAIDWVSLPNTMGMSQYGDGGIVGTKPYCATGNYINRMSNFCPNCRYEYQQSTGENACPFTTLYWEFLDRHCEKLKKNGRMRIQLRNLEVKRNDKDFLRHVRKRAEQLRYNWNKFLVDD